MNVDVQWPRPPKSLANRPSQPEAERRLYASLADFLTWTGDSWANNSMASVEDQGRPGRFEAPYAIEEYPYRAAKHPDSAPGD